MKATRILLISGLVFLAAIFVVGIYIVPKLQADQTLLMKTLNDLDRKVKES